MSQNKQAESTQNKKEITTIRITGSTTQLLQSLFQKINNKEFGKKTTKDDIIYEALQILKMNKKSIENLKLKNMTLDDEEKYVYKMYQIKNGAISWDDFKRKMRRGELTKFMRSIGIEV